MHFVAEPEIFYLGTPVILISTRNEDGTANLAPFSSAWWLGGTGVLGLNGSSQTVKNLMREQECVVNVPSANLASAVDRLALLTGSREMSNYKEMRGYRHEPDKFGVSGLTSVPADSVKAPLVQECSIQLECTVSRIVVFGEADPRLGSMKAVAALVLRSHIEESLIVPGRPNHVDPLKWEPLIMSFAEFFSLFGSVYGSRLATVFGFRDDGTGKESSFMAGKSPDKL